MSANKAKARNRTDETPAHVRHVQDLRSSNAAGAHATGRTRRDRDRGNTRRRAIAESA